jgi:hypothetical protein
VLAGWGNRNYSWQVSTSLQQELWPGWSATVGYYRNWYENFYLNVNQAVTAADFTEFCYTVPTDARIPGGGGNRVCGNYDVSPARFGQVNNRIALAKTLGIDLSRVYNGVDVSLNGRFDNGAYMQGGLSIGRTVLDDCALNTVPNAFAIGNGYVADSFDTTVGGFKHPGTTEYCHITPPWEHSYQLKLLGVYPLPLGFQISGVFQNLPGIHVITSNSPNYCATTSCRTYTNAEIAPSLGRNLAAGPAGTVILPIVAPQALFEERLTQLDVRFIKGVRVGRASIKGTLDIYNVFNSSSVQRVNGTFGAGYRNALVIMAARLAKIGAQVEF